MKAKAKRKKYRTGGKPPSKVVIKGLGSRLRSWRKSVPMKMMELAELIKVSQGSLSDIERAKSNPSAMSLVSLMGKTSLNIHWLLTGIVGDITEGETKKPEQDAMVITLTKNSPPVLIKRI